MRYQIKDKHNFFIREDGDSSMVLFKEKHDQFILNGTGLVMFNLILENNQTQKVLEELKKIYENIEIAVLENDLQDIIRMLKMYGILVMEQEIEENVCKHTDISAVDENDYEKVGRFVEENRCSDFFVAGGKGYYQEWGKPVQCLKPGDIVNIPPEIKHWHGAVKDSWFSHLAVEVPAKDASNEWCEPVTDEEYEKL